MIVVNTHIGAAAACAVLQDGFNTLRFSLLRVSFPSFLSGEVNWKKDEKATSQLMCWKIAAQKPLPNSSGSIDQEPPVRSQEAAHA
jgi:hypothetical protein